MIIISSNLSCHWTQLKGTIPVQFLRCSHAEEKKMSNVLIQFLQWFFGMLDVNLEILSNLIFLTSEVLQWWAHPYARTYFWKYLGMLSIKHPLLPCWEADKAVNQYLPWKDFSGKWFSCFCNSTVFYLGIFIYLPRCA